METIATVYVDMVNSDHHDIAPLERKGVVENSRLK
jgi:hypothetical protein